MSTQDMLQNHGSNTAGAVLEREEVILKDTVFADPSQLLVDVDLFGGDNKDGMYKNVAFPVTSHAFSITHLRVVHNVAFTVSDPKSQNTRLQHFEENSRFDFEYETHIIGKGIPLSLLTKATWMDLGAITATGTYIQPVAKFAEWYKLDAPIEIGAGKQFKVTFKAAKGLTTLAYSASDTPYIPNATANLSCASSGHWIQVYMRGIRFIPAR